jgi:hypothetical protein
VLQIPHDRLAHTGELRELGLGQSGFLPVALDQLGQSNHCCFSSNKRTKTVFSRPKSKVINKNYRLKGKN